MFKTFLFDLLKEYGPKIVGLFLRWLGRKLFNKKGAAKNAKKPDIGQLWQQFKKDPKEGIK